jgi:hypothetical protein
MAVQVGFPRWDTIRRMSGRESGGHRPRQAGGLAACPAGSRTAVGRWDAAGLSWTWWDMIQNLRRADQAHSGTTDATRTERGINACACR